MGCEVKSPAIIEPTLDASLVVLVAAPNDRTAATRAQIRPFLREEFIRPNPQITNSFGC